jgi:AcrR family transcriptional regulator
MYSHSLYVASSERGLPMRQDGRRAATTAATRRAIIDAGRDLLAAGDWRGFTLDAVAAAAGVTRVTVYNQVHSKSGLLDAVLTDLTERAGMDQLLTTTKTMPAEEARAHIVERTCRFWHAERPVLRPLFGLSAVDKDIAANLAQRERWRADQLDRLLDRLAEKPSAEPLPPRDIMPRSRVLAMPRSQVLAGLVAVTSFPAYDALGPLADDPMAATAVIDHLVRSLTGRP